MTDWRTLGHPSLPGPSKFLAAAADALLRDGVLWIGLPAAPPAWLIPAMQEAIRTAASARVFDGNASSGLGGMAPAHWLASLSSPVPTSIRSVADFLDDPEFADAAYVVHGIRRANWRAWAGFLRLVRTERVRKPRIASPLVVIAPPEGTPQQEVRSAVGTREHRWQGRVSRLDTEIAVAKRLGWPSSHDVASATAAACAVEVAGWDLRLVDVLTRLGEEQQLNPLPALEPDAAKLPDVVPSWDNGVIDIWDGQPFEHTLSLLRRGRRDAAARRVWQAQVRVLFPFLGHIRSCVVRRYRDELMRDGPLVKTFHSRTEVIAQPEKFEFFDIHDRLQARVPERDAKFLRLCHKLRSSLAHFDPAPADFVVNLGRFWEENSHRYGDEWPGWDWPRCGQRLVILVGPSGAGKSTWAANNCDPADVISSDDIRRQIFGSMDVAGDQEAVFERVRQEAARRLAAGRSAVIDATNIKAGDRRANAVIVPSDLEVEYVVIDRPMDEKLATAGWRLSRPGLIENHSRAFAAEVEQILRGDGLPNVKVVDLRQGNRAAAAE